MSRPVRCWMSSSMSWVYRRIPSTGRSVTDQTSAAYLTGRQTWFIRSSACLEANIARLFPNRAAHDPRNLQEAREIAGREDVYPIGLFYRNPNPRPPIDAQDPGLQSGPLAGQPLGLSKEQRLQCIEEFM